MHMATREKLSSTCNKICSWPDSSALTYIHSHRRARQLNLFFENGSCLLSRTVRCNQTRSFPYTNITTKWKCPHMINLLMHKRSDALILKWPPVLLADYIDHQSSFLFIGIVASLPLPFTDVERTRGKQWSHSIQDRTGRGWNTI